MLEYSAKKKRANEPPAYSILNPETNSDSPSVKSNGARLVSASVEMYHIMAKGHVGMISQMVSWLKLNVCSVKPPVKIIRARRIRASVTS